MTNPLNKPISRKQLFIAGIILFELIMVGYTIYAFFIIPGLAAAHTVKGTNPYPSSVTGVVSAAATLAPAIKKYLDKISATNYNAEATQQELHDVQGKLARTEAKLESTEAQMHELTERFTVLETNYGAVYRENRDLKESASQKDLQIQDQARIIAARDTRIKVLTAERDKLRKQVSKYKGDDDEEA